MSTLQIEYRPLEALIPYARNARTHTEAQVAQIAASIREFGWTNPILVDGQSGVIAGHGRLLAARVLALPQVPCIELSHLTDAQRRAYILADNRLALNAGWDEELLALEMAELKALDVDLTLLGFGDEEISSLLDQMLEDAPPVTTLAERFVVPPMSVLDTRQGYWKERRDAWLAQGIESEVGRDKLLTFSISSQPPEVYKAKNDFEARAGHAVSWQEFFEAHPEECRQPGTSIFDPVLCEIAYRWFCPPGGRVLDPFAGGSVRGIVAELLGRPYTGLELRREQVDANRAQAERLFQNAGPQWIHTDSLQMDEALPPSFEADFLFSCPPYADLEVYSDDPADLSTKAYPEFLSLYRTIIQKAVARLGQHRFVVWVVGEVRGKDGHYRGFVPDTIRAFEDAGAVFYNEAILVNHVASAAVRAGRTFEASRKLCKVHQNVLVFVKGDPKRATEAIGPVQCGDVQEAFACE